MPEIPDDMREHNRKLIEAFRASKGLEGRPLLLLTTTGARSGQPHTTPMMYVHAEGKLLVVASNAGAPAHPDWYRNLAANPPVTVEMGPETFEATAVVPEGEERDRLFGQIAEQHPFFNDHQAGVTRTIPVVILERR